MKPTFLALLALGTLLAGCSSNPTNEQPPAVATQIDSFGANPNPTPTNVATQFSFSLFGSGLTCQLDVEGDGKVDYTINNCSSSSRVNHTYGVQGSYTAQLTLTGSDGVVQRASAPVQVVAPNIPPVPQVQITAPTASDSDSLAVVFNWQVEDANSDITHCRFDAQSDGVWDYDGLCSGLPATSSEVKASSLVRYSVHFTYPKPGKYTATLEAADPYSKASTTVQVRAPYNRSPIINTFNAVAGDNQLATIEFAVNDPDGDTLECTLTVEGVGTFRMPNCTQATRRYTFKTEGSYLITLVASDSLGGRVSNSRVVNFGEKIIAEATLSLGESSTCFLTPAGKVYCWGANGYGNLGNGTYEPANTPQLVQTDVRFKQIEGGYRHTCALSEAGENYCWGSNNFGQVGDGTTQLRPVPTKTVTDLRFKQITTGSYNTCGLTQAGDTYCWGFGDIGILGQKDDIWANSFSPLQVKAGGVKFVQIEIGYKHVCALTAGGEVYCWGYDKWGEIGIDQNGPGTDPNNSYDPAYFDSPQQVAKAYSFKRIVVGYYFTCGLTKATPTEVYSWGKNGNGSLGTGDWTSSYNPRKVVGDHHFEKHQGGSYSEHSCGIKANGEAWCWGYDYKGNLGVGTTSPMFTPQQIQTFKFSQISTSGLHSCGYTLDEQLMCWGGNDSGQLGDGTYTDRTTPVYVKPLP